MTKQLVPNIVRGGIAIPIPGRPNYYYMKGRKHKNGGIDIGENPRTGIEVEDGEVLHIAPGEMRVFSAQPFLYGGSPANRVLAGDNPNQVFAAQEEYKDRNNLNDDGTKKKKCGGKKKTNNRIYSITTNKGTKLRYLENDKPFDYEKFDNGGYKLTAEDSPIEYLYTNPDGKKVYMDNYGAQYIQNGDKVELYNGGHGNSSDFNVLFPTMEEIKEYYQPNTDIYFNNTDAIAEANPNYYWDREFSQETPSLSDVTTPILEGIKWVDGTYDTYGNYVPYWKRPMESGTYSFTRPIIRQAAKQAARQATKQAVRAQSKSIARSNAKWARKVATRELPQVNVTPATNYEEAARIAGRFWGKLLPKVKSNITKITKPIAKPVGKTLKSLGEGIGKFFERGLNLNDAISEFYNVDGVSSDSPYWYEGNREVLLHTDYIPQTDSKGNIYYVKNPLRLYRNGGKINMKRRKYRTGGDDENGVVVPTSLMWVERTVPYNNYDDVGIASLIIDDTSPLPYTPGIIGYSRYPIKYKFEKPKETITTEYTPDSDISEEQIVAPPINSSNKGYNMSSTSTNKTVASTTPVASTTKTTNITGKPNLTLKDILGSNFVGIGDIYDLIDKFHKSKEKPELDIPTITKEQLLRNANNNPRIRRAKLKRVVNSAPFRDLASVSSNLIGSLAGYYMNKKMLEDMKYPGQPILEQAAKLKTNYNINPRLANIRENLANVIDDVSANTSSSNVAINRINRARLAAMLQSDQLYGEKENQETQLINQDKLNRQEVANRNVDTYNDWRQRKVDFENAVREQQANNQVALANNINSAVQGVIGNINQRIRDNNTIKAYLIANPNVPAELYYNEGLITLGQLKNIYARREAEKQYQLELAKLTNVAPSTTINE